MQKVVISYRRSDSDIFAGRVRDRIAARFGEESVFIDIDNIPLGSDFRAHISRTLSHASAVLVIVGDRWLGIHKNGSSRIRDDNDPVRTEIELALDKKLRIFPILVGNAQMPKETQLPDKIQEFAFINAASVDTGRNFHRDMDRVIASLSEIFDVPQSKAQDSSKAIVHHRMEKGANWVAQHSVRSVIALILAISLAVGLATTLFFHYQNNPSHQNQDVIPHGTTPAFFACNTQAQCALNTVCVDNGGDNKFFCKPTCKTDADCSGFPYSAGLKCFVHLRSDGSAFSQRICNNSYPSYVGPTSLHD